jgi:1-acyl-sn-glycerol-3-phosphate acyltransferase
MKYIVYFFHYLFWPLVAVLTFVSALNLKRKSRHYRKDSNFYMPQERYKMVYKFVKKVLYILNVKVQVDKSFLTIPKKPVLYIINHKSNIDPIVIFKALYENLTEDEMKTIWFKFVGKIELEKKKNFITSILILLDTLFIDRDNLRQQLQVFNSQVSHIEKNNSVIVFIEGTRIYEHELGDFKAAALKLSFKTLAPIQPIVIFGSSGLFDKNKSGRIKGRTCYIKALKVLNMHDYLHSNEVFLASKIKDDMGNEYQRMYQRYQNKKKIIEE